MVIKHPLNPIYSYPEGVFLLRKLHESVRSEARRIQAASASRLSYEAARELACKKLGFGHQRLFKKIVAQIEERNADIANCPRRIRCAHQEKILDGHEYYALRVEIALGNDSETLDLEEFVVGMQSYSTPMTMFIRYADQSNTTEIRCIDIVNPERFLSSASRWPGSVYIINRLEDLYRFPSWGGNALVECRIFRESGLFLRYQGEFRYRPKEIDSLL